MNERIEGEVLSDRGPSPELAPLAALLEGMSPEALAEVERALFLSQPSAPTPAQQRVDELGALADLLESDHAEHVPDDPYAPVRVDQRLYDELRPPGAPSSKRLVERYRDWLGVCRAAWGLLPDGRRRGPGKPWSSPMRGGPKPPAYTREECIAAYRACALSLGRRPSSNVYVRWVDTRCRKARARNIQRSNARRAPKPWLRLPRPKSFARHFAGWGAVAGAAGLTDAEIDAAWRWRLCVLQKPSTPPPAGPDTPLGRFRELGDDVLAELEVSPAERSELLSQGFLSLPLSRSAQLAYAMGGSLDWLAGRTHDPGQAAEPNVRFSGDAFRQLRKQRHVPEETVLEALDWTLGELRRVLSGRDDPALGAVVTLAGMLTTSLDQLCSPA